MKLPPPRSLRGRLTLVVAGGSLLLVVALIVGFNVVLRDQIRSDIDSRLGERASAALANVAVRDGRVRVREAPGDEAIDQQVWVFADGRAVESPPEPRAVSAAARAAAARPGSHVDVPALDVRLHSLPIVHAGQQVGAVVAGVSVGPYETTANRALVASVVLGLLIIAGVLVAVRLSIGAALRPVDRMTAEAATWSVDDLDQRFALPDSDDELARLAATFNDLLGRLAASFRHERRFSAEVSHELRTPLAKLIMESELALRRERSRDEYRDALEGVAADARQMQRVVETLLAVARSEVDPRTGTSDAALVASAVVDSLSPATSGVSIDVTRAPGGLRLGVDGDLAERVLAPVVANAIRFARRRASIEIRGSDGSVEFLVRDDGPGVAPDQREAIFAPGFRGNGAGPGTGLGLALARRLARAADGDVTSGGGGATGGTFVVSLPAA